MQFLESSVVQFQMEENVLGLIYLLDVFVMTLLEIQRENMRIILGGVARTL